jgi:PAS domain S-box-containing protein
VRARFDVADRERLEQLCPALLRAHDDLGEAVLIADAGLRLVYTNAGASRMLGYSPEELGAMPSLVGLVSENERERVADATMRRIRGRAAPAFLETEMRHKDGHSVPVEIALEALRATGELHAVAIVRDVGERRRAETTLQRRTEELAVLYDTTLGIVNRLDTTSLLQALVARAAALMDTEHGYLYVLEPDGLHLSVRVGTGAFADWIGFRLRRGEGIGGRVWETGETFAVDDYHAWSGGRPEFSFLRATVGIPLRARREVAGVIGVARLEDHRPFTADQIGLLRRFAHMASLALEIARLFEDEREAHGRLRALDETRRGFVSALSHELRSPLAVALGYALTLERGEGRFSPEQRKEMLRGIVAGARGIERLFSDFVELDRLVHGEGRAMRRPVQVKPLILGAVADASLADRRVALDVDDVTASLDGALVRRIADKLLDNVSKHTGRDASVWVSAKASDGGLLLSVEDDGPGVPAELRGPIFEPFLQGPDTPSYSPGIGVGLGLVARFAELHGGRAWVEDRPGGGAAFRVLLPPPP